jgi:hypothetical protein
MVVVVTGMHRSGTSLTARVVEALGVDLGRDLIPGDRSNLRGYFEDAGFVAFHRRVLRAAVPAGARGWADWGWTEGEELDAAVVAASAPEARRIADARAQAAAGQPWGWKDPRTTLLLPFWDEILTDARYLLVYRAPWEVVDSMARVHEGAFVSRPDWVVRAWDVYNRALLEFVGAHRDRCTLVGVGAFVESPREAVDLLVRRTGLDADESLRERVAALVEPALLGRSASDTLFERLVRAASPSSVELLGRLDAAADLAPRRRSAEPLPLEAGDATALLVHWRAGEAERDRFAERLAAVEADLERVRAESEARHGLFLDKERESLARRDYIEELERRLRAPERG